MSCAKQITSSMRLRSVVAKRIFDRVISSGTLDSFWQLDDENIMFREEIAESDDS